ncbi:hypothetical protein TEA_028697 [Camellia sinensis var. sinensis]|uniref:Uncharacterized protein n=1 Tax=Camellia sinensis var. sinensis TaxID=542762 RepID=A0A4S4F242_CAMSN|nr:hypothetical protein TEA_028697 [Camellia sinensis var. sinensis]
MGRAHFSVCFDILFTARVFSLSHSHSHSHSHSRSEFQHRKQLEIRVLRRSRRRLTQFSSVKISCGQILSYLGMIIETDPNGYNGYPTRNTVFSLPHSHSHSRSEFQHRKQLEIRVLRRSRWRLTQFSSVLYLSLYLGERLNRTASGSKSNMPSLQTALPPELANNAIRQYNTELVVDMVRQQFKKHMHETDSEKIQKLKDDAARGLINHMLYESEKMSGRKFSNST